jgi:thiol-disulfide isomerase/thioredoxin
VKIPAWGLLLTTLVGAGIGFATYRHSFPERPTLRAQPVAAAAAGAAGPADPTTADVAADVAAAPATPPVPEEVPALSLTDMAGRKHPLRGSSGRPRLYNFWATWCEPCRREIPLLNTLEARYRGDRLEVVGVAIDFQDALTTFLAKTPLHYTLLVGEEDGLEAAQRFGMSMALPFSVFADGQNRIVAVKLGELHADEIAAILGRMREVRSGKATLAESRAAIGEDIKTLAVKRAKQSADL